MPQGLSTSDAKKVLSEYGFNEIIEVSKSTPLKILLRQVQRNFVLYMLVAAVVISFFVGKPVTAYTVLAVILIVIFVGFFQEYKAEESINSLKKMIMPFSIVYRDGKKKEIPSREIVPGDVVVLGLGEKIPADCKLIESFDLRVNESALTGESKEIQKVTLKDLVSVATEINHIFMGTFIVNGRCIAEVLHTGMNTEFGKIAHLISTAEKTLPLQIKVNRIAKYMVTVALVASLATGVIMLFRTPTINSTALVEILILMIALCVSAFPEGFPVVLATTLAVGAKRMAKRNAIVSRMSIIETLGEVSVICSDKTGTITHGEMTVKFLFTHKGLYEVGGAGYSAKGKIVYEGKEIELAEDKNLKALLEASVLCNNSEIERTGEDGQYKTFGSSTETALLILGAKAGLFKENFLGNRIHECPFNSSRKMMSTFQEKEGKYFVYAKGAPDIILDKCTSIYSNGTHIALNPHEKKNLLDLQQEMSKNAYRTLAVCYKEEKTNDTHYQEEDFVFLGLIAMEDSPREEVAEAISVANNAGIRVYMITGDSKETALSVAKQIGIDPEIRILDGKELDELSDAELEVIIKQPAVFARVKPEHKIRLVKIFKDMGEIVAMTGDGVNDAPALKEAHVGIAMGKNGTDVSRNAADIILKDDNFATIITAIAEGRTVFNNIRKFATYQLSCNLSEIITIFVGVLLAPFFGWQTPILVSMQILFMNLVTDNLPALTLGLNSTSNDIMKDKPRDKGDILNTELIKLLISTAVIMAFAALASYYIMFNVYGLDWGQSRTVALLTLILVEIVTAFSFRSFRKMTLNRSPLINKYMAGAATLSFIFTLIVIYTPISEYFETHPVGLSGWVVAAIICGVVLILNDVIKAVNLRRPSYISSTK